MINMKKYLEKTNDSLFNEEFKGKEYLISRNDVLGYIGVSLKAAEEEYEDVFFIQGDEAGFYLDLHRDGQLLKYLDSAGAL